MNNLTITQAIDLIDLNKAVVLRAIEEQDLKLLHDVYSSLSYLIKELEHLEDGTNENL